MGNSSDEEEEGVLIDVEEETEYDYDEVDEVEASFCGGFSFDKFWEYVKTLKYFWIAILFSSGWCAIWYVWFRYGDLPPATDYIYALSDFGIVFSLFFYEYLRKSWQDYTAGPQLYYRMLFKIWMLGVDIYSVLEVTDDKGEVMNNEKIGPLIDSTKREVDTLLYHTSLIFMPHKRTVLTKPHSDICLDEPDSTNGFIVSVCQLKRLLSDLQRHDCITTAGLNSLHKKMDGLYKSIEDIKTSQTVNDLDAIYVHVVIVIGIYFVIIIPYKIVTSVSYFVFLLYPFLIFSMMGTFMIRRYVGSPFDRHSPAKNPLHRWYNHFLDANNNSYKKFLSMCAELRHVKVEFSSGKFDSNQNLRERRNAMPYVENLSLKHGRVPEPHILAHISSQHTQM